MTIQRLSDISTKGLVIYDGDKYKYVLQSEIPNHEIAPDDTLKKLVELNVAVALLQGQAERVFVDYNQLVFEDGTSPLPQGKTADPNKSKRQIVVHDAEKFYSIDESSWKELPDEGDAQVLVRRGATIAVIPHNNILLGTYCVLVNLATLRH